MSSFGDDGSDLEKEESQSGVVAVSPVRRQPLQVKSRRSSECAAARPGKIESRSGAGEGRARGPSRIAERQPSLPASATTPINHVAIRTRSVSIAIGYATSQSSAHTFLPTPTAPRQRRRPRPKCLGQTTSMTMVSSRLSFHHLATHLSHPN